MSKEKLTLSIGNKQLVNKAKSYAKKSGLSLSVLVENFLLDLVKKNDKDRKTVTLPNGDQMKLTGTVAKLGGWLAGYDEGLDYKNEAREHRANRILGKKFDG